MTVAKPSGVAPSVPSAKEAGLHDFDLFSWFGMCLSKNAPKEVVDKLTDWMDESVLTGETPRAKFAPMGFEPWLSARGVALREFTKGEMAKWKTVVKIAKIPSP